ncbi:hypothetical protein C8Q76DRAFT_692237 [Earliella scabrosa]|nr:hypothetical protein C8Q76DRAFT_692237 [Earliella scabrosa]
MEYIYGLRFPPRAAVEGADAKDLPTTPCGFKSRRTPSLSDAAWQGYEEPSAVSTSAEPNASSSPGAVPSPGHPIGILPTGIYTPSLAMTSTAGTPASDFMNIHTPSPFALPAPIPFPHVHVYDTPYFQDSDSLRLDMGTSYLASGSSNGYTHCQLDLLTWDGNAPINFETMPRPWLVPDTQSNVHDLWFGATNADYASRYPPYHGFSLEHNPYPSGMAADGSGYPQPSYDNPSTSYPLHLPWNHFPDTMPAAHSAFTGHPVPSPSEPPTMNIQGPSQLFQPYGAGIPLQAPRSPEAPSANKRGKGKRAHRELDDVEPAPVPSKKARTDTGSESVAVPDKDKETRTDAEIEAILKDLVIGRNAAGDCLCLVPECGQKRGKPCAVRVHHRETHLNYSKFRCPYPGCVNRYKRNVGLKDHMKRDHGFEDVNAAQTTAVMSTVSQSDGTGEAEDMGEVDRPSKGKGSGKGKGPSNGNRGGGKRKAGNGKDAGYE